MAKMFEAVTTLLVYTVYFYAAFGLFFGTVFVTVGVSRVDEQAHGSGWGFRLLILPGSIAFWPLLMKRWLWGPHTPPEERNPHQ